MKIIFLGDIHGRSIWKIIANTQEYDYIVFIGDYFDSRNISGLEQLNNFKEIIEFKNKYPDKVVLLIGNHDAGYFSGPIDQSIVSGYQHKMLYPIRAILDENRDNMQMAFQYQMLLATHAGVTETWLDNNGWDDKVPIVDYINDLWKYKPIAFDFTGIDPSGDNITQSPVWVRPRSLMKDTKNIPFIQIVGHTTMVKLNLEYKQKFIFIDTLDVGQYLVWEDDVFTVQKI